MAYVRKIQLVKLWLTGLKLDLLTLYLKKKKKIMVQQKTKQRNKKFDQREGRIFFLYIRASKKIDQG